MPPRPTWRDRSKQWKVELYGREEYSIILPKCWLPCYIWGSFTCRKSTTWDRRLYFPSEGRRAEDFFTLKNPMASAGLEPANSGTKGQHAAPRPPKPLWQQGGDVRVNDKNSHPLTPSAVTTTATLQHGLACHNRNGVFCDEEKTTTICPGESTDNVQFSKSCWNSTMIRILANPQNAHSLFLQVQTHESWLHHWSQGTYRVSSSTSIQLLMASQKAALLNLSSSGACKELKLRPV
jgi:hypothetical protein